MQAHQQSASGAAQAIDREQLSSHIRTLISLEETETPIVSWYIEHDPERDSTSASFNRRVRALRWVLRGQELDQCEETFERVQRYLTNEVRPTTRGVAIFARAGTRPFFLGLQLQVPVPGRLSVNSTPNVHHLVKLNDKSADIVGTRAGAQP